MRQLKNLPTHIIQQRQRDPQKTQRESSNETSKRVRKDNALGWIRAFRGARKPLVQHFVQSVENRAHADDEIAKGAVLGFAGGGSLLAAGAAPRFGAVFRGGCVAVRYDEDTRDGDGYCDDLARPDLLVQDRDTEGIRKESRAIVNRRQIARRRQVHSDIPTSTRERQRAGDERSHLEHVVYRRDLRLARRRVQRLVLHHQRRLPQQLDVPAPEGRPRLAPVLNAQEEQLRGP